MGKIAKRVGAFSWGGRGEREEPPGPGCHAVPACGYGHSPGPQLEEPGPPPPGSPPAAVLLPISASAGLSWALRPPTLQRPSFPSATCLQRRGPGGQEPQAGRPPPRPFPLLPAPLPPAASQPPPQHGSLSETRFCPLGPGTVRVTENSCPESVCGGEGLLFSPLRGWFSQLSHPSSCGTKGLRPPCAGPGPARGLTSNSLLSLQAPARHSIKKPFPFVRPGPQLSPLSCDGRSQL